MTNVKNPVVLDCEVYPNYFLVAFKALSTGKVVTLSCEGVDGRLSEDDRKKLFHILRSKNTFGFNSLNYDMPIMLYALGKATCKDIYGMSEYIITNSSRYWKTLKRYGLRVPKQFRHFDIMGVPPAVMISLKLYGARVHSNKLQDLPIEPGTMLTKEDIEVIEKYCVNDLDTTIDLYNLIPEQLGVRVNLAKEYGDVVLSKSDAEIAEMVMKCQISKHNSGRWLSPPKIPQGTTFRYTSPEYIEFHDPELKKVLDFVNTFNFEMSDKGSVELPKQLCNTKMKIGKAFYQLGVGGIHSGESGACHVPNENQLLVDRDVTSYYPTIILNLGIYPPQLGKHFLSVYKKLVIDRLEAKSSGNVTLSESLKIVINGTCGKFGQSRSVMYAPESSLKVVLTGQLSLLMLIETLELSGIVVVSANTDGFVSLLDKDDYTKYDEICKDWERATGFNLEETRYKALYSRDVNNYLAETESGHKGKGIYTLGGLKKNPYADICTMAVVELLLNRKPISRTIYECKDITKFILVRKVNGGATWRGEYLGKVVRWIYSVDGDKIYYKKANKSGNHSKVAKTDGSRPVMQLEGFPSDIDYDKYYNKALSMLDELGFTNL